MEEGMISIYIEFTWLCNRKDARSARAVGDMTAEGFLSKVIASGFESPGTASAANPFELACAAFSSEAIVIPQGYEYLGMLPYVGKGALADVPTVGAEKAARLDIPHVGDETEADASEAPAGNGIQTMRFK